MLSFTKKNVHHALSFACRLGYRTASTEVNEPLYFLMVQDRLDSLG